MTEEKLNPVDRQDVSYHIQMDEAQCKMCAEGLTLLHNLWIEENRPESDEHMELSMLISMFKELKPEDRDVIHGFCL